MENLKIKNAKDMSIEELAGQVIMVGLPGKELDDEYKKFISDYKIGNYILFARNYQDTKQMKSFMKDLYEHAINTTGSYPLVSIDQEGGMVVRLFKDVTFPASPMTTSASLNPLAPYIAGKIIALDMLKMGINFNLAPCLEINKDLLNSVMNVRSYGGTKEIVLKNAKMFVQGIQETGCIACLKHYPGSGSTEKDSHLELPIIDEEKEVLINYNMYPFFNIKEAKALMSSHCVYSSFDSLPSTLSYILLTKTLREEMGYNGLIISDGMEMHAILDNYGIKEGTIMALNAGCDLLLLCHDYEYQKIALDAVIEALKTGRITKELLVEKVERINKAKEELLKSLEEHFNSSDYIVNQEEHNIMQEIVDNSYTLIKGIPPQLKDKTLIISSTTKVASIVEDEFDNYNLTNSLKKEFKNHQVLDFNDITLPIDISNYDNVIIYSYDAYNSQQQIDIIKEIFKTNKEVFLVSLKGPIDSKCFENIKNYACLYEYTPNSIKTVIKQLKQEITMNGKLPK